MTYWHRFYQTRTAKIVIWLIGIAIFSAVLLFTPVGNRTLFPIVENTLSSQLATKIVVDEFTLSHKRFELVFHDELNNTVSARGGFSLLTMQMYAHYRISCSREGGINPLRDPFTADGALHGGFVSFTIDGEASVFNGKAHYELQLYRLHLANLKLVLTDIAYEPLMHQLDYPSDTDTRICGSVNLSGLERRDVAGSITLTSTTGRFTPTPIQDDDNESFDIRSLLADEHGRIRAFDVNVSLSASITHAGILEQFIKFPLNGPLSADAALHGNQKLLLFDVRSGVSGSDSTLSVKIPDLDPSEITFDVEHADLSQLFNLFGLRPPVTGICNSTGHIDSEGGMLDLQVKDGRSVPSVLKRDFNLTQPSVAFDAFIHADLRPGGVRYRAAFRSDLARMEIDRDTTHEQMLRDLLSTIR